MYHLVDIGCALSAALGEEIAEQPLELFDQLVHYSLNWLDTFQRDLKTTGQTAAVPPERIRVYVHFDVIREIVPHTMHYPVPITTQFVPNELSDTPELMFVLLGQLDEAPVHSYWIVDRQGFHHVSVLIGQ